MRLIVVYDVMEVVEGNTSRIQVKVGCRIEK